MQEESWTNLFISVYFIISSYRSPEAELQDKITLHKRILKILPT